MNIAEAFMSHELSWYGLWTRSNCEQLVYDQLAARDFEVFLPLMGSWNNRRGKRYLTRTPMFPGYLFLHHKMDKVSYVDITKSRGLVCVLGPGWDRLSAVPDSQVDSIRQLVDSHLPVLPYPYLKDGQRLRVKRGPFQDMEGFLVRTNPTKGLLVMSVDLLGRSVAVEIDCTMVA